MLEVATTRLEPLSRKRELRAFLMGRRARLQPADVGLASAGRRRAPGLRREEVAQLAGLSTAWYTMFEMAKETSVSPRALASIARALRLTPAETQHLRTLATLEEDVPPAPPPPVVDATLRAVMDGFATGPAFVLDHRMDVLAMNAPAIAVFGDLLAEDGYERNWLWSIFARAGTERGDGAEDAHARAVAGAFRATFCEHAADAAFRTFLEDLLAASPTFRRYWSDHHVDALEEPHPVTFVHARLGALRFTFRALPASAQTHARLCFLIPDAATAGTLAAAGLTTASI